MRRRLALALAPLLSSACTGRAGVHVAAAISLEPWLVPTLASYPAGSGSPARPTFGASGILEQQIEAGAPVEVYLSASPMEVDALAPRVIARRVIASNRLVLALSREGRAIVHRPADLAFGAVHRVALGRPKSVPAGRYAQEALERLSLWRPLLPKLIFASHVAEVRAWIERGDVEAGFVYASEAAGLPAVLPLPEAPRVQIVAALLSPATASSRRLYDYLASPERLPSLQAVGFSPP